MNLLKHYIIEVYSIKDVAEEYEKAVGRKLEQPALKITMKINCCGKEEKTTQYFLQKEWEHTLKQGYYMA